MVTGVKWIPRRKRLPHHRPQKRLFLLDIGGIWPYRRGNPSIRVLRVERAFDFLKELQMSLSSKQADSLLQRGFSRRDLGRVASLLTAGAALPFYNEFAMAQDAQQRTLRGTGGSVSVSATPLQRTSQFADQRRCNWTMTCVAFAGAW